MLTGEWWLAGVRRSRRSKKVEGKGDLIENIGTSGSVLWKYESCIQNRVENFEVLETKVCLDRNIDRFAEDDHHQGVFLHTSAFLAEPRAVEITIRCGSSDLVKVNQSRSRIAALCAFNADVRVVDIDAVEDGSTLVQS